MVCYPEFKAGQAEVCHVDKVTDAGGGTVHYVRLPDGYLLDCGCSGVSQKRAEVVAGLVNVLMRWAGQWPPTGNVEAIIHRNWADLESIGRPYSKG